MTVPPFYNDTQRQLTKLAATNAGLEVLRVINEPTAAAICYGLDKQADENEIFHLVLDFGAGNFIVTFLSVEDGIFELKEIIKDEELGGRMFDLRLAEFCARDIML